MIKVFALALLTVCVCLPDLCAQEMAGQGLTAPEPRQRSSSAIAMAIPGNDHNVMRVSSSDLIPPAIQQQAEGESLPPFPVLMPKAIVYPRKAIRKGWEGQTVVAAEVLADGSVGRTALAKSSGHVVLDQAAQEAIQSWKFKNEAETDETVPQYVDIPVTFKLQGEE